MKTLSYVTVLCMLFLSCNQNDFEIDPVPQKIASTEVGTDVEKELPGLSIYHLPSTWRTQDNQELMLEELRGKVLIVTMIYTSCTTACPRLLHDMRNIEKQIPQEDLDKVRFVMVSIDPETDTTERLKEFSKIHHMEDDHWVFLTGSPENTREFANVLAVNYNKISPMKFSHSNIISVFNEDGVLAHQKEGLGMDYAEIVAAINNEIHN